MCVWGDLHRTKGVCVWGGLHRTKGVCVWGDLHHTKGVCVSEAVYITLEVCVWGGLHHTKSVCVWDGLYHTKGVIYCPSVFTNDQSKCLIFNVAWVSHPHPWGLLVLYHVKDSVLDHGYWRWRIPVGPEFFPLIYSTARLALKHRFPSDHRS